MASSFTLTSKEYEGRYMELVCTQTKDIANNRSNISWTLSSIGGQLAYYATGPTTITINGVQVYYKERNWGHRGFPESKGSVSGKIDVDHLSDGTKSISVSMVTDIYDNVMDTYSGTWTLDDIQRHATITDAPDFTDIKNPTITYSNPAGDALTSLKACISLTGEKDDIEYRDIPKNERAYTFNLTDEERAALRNGTPGTERTVTFVVQSEIGGITNNSTLTRKLTIVETEATKPTVAMTVALNNSSLPSAFSDVYIQGKSRVDISLSATGKYGASVQSYSAVVDGKTYNAGNFTSDAVQGSGSLNIVGYAKDSRGFTGSVETTINVFEYTKPMVIPIDGENAIQCYRSDGNGNRVGNSTSVWIKAQRSYYNLSQKNTCTLRWRRKLVTEAWNDSKHTWSNLIAGSSTSTNVYNALLPDVVFNLKDSYTIQIQAVDDIGEYDTKTFEVPTQDVALHLGRGGKNVAVGTYCDYTEDYTFYSEWKAIFDKDVVIHGNLSIDGKTLEEYIKSVINGGG